MFTVKIKMTMRILLLFLAVSFAASFTRRCFSATRTTTRAAAAGRRLLFLSAASNATVASENTSVSSLTRQEAETYRIQAEALRREAQELRQRLDAEAAAKKARELARIDQWIDDLLVADRLGGSSNGDGETTAVELLYSVDQVTRLLQDKRMSEEHVMSMFRRLSQLSPASRSHCSPLVELLVEAAGRMDCIEREEQPNKRWSGKVERKLRRRLFANDWGIDLDDLEEQEAQRRE